MVADSVAMMVSDWESLRDSYLDSPTVQNLVRWKAMKMGVKMVTKKDYKTVELSDLQKESKMD